MGGWVSINPNIVQICKSIRIIGRSLKTLWTLGYLRIFFLPEGIKEHVLENWDSFVISWHFSCKPSQFTGFKSPVVITFFIIQDHIHLQAIRQHSVILWLFKDRFQQRFLLFKILQIHDPIRYIVFIGTLWFHNGWDMLSLWYTVQF